MYAVNIVDVAHEVRNKGMSWQDGINSVEAAQQTIQTRWDAYLNTELVDAEKKLVDELKPLLKTADKATAELVQIFSAQEQQQLDNFVLNQLYPSIEPVSERFTQLVDVQLAVAEDVYNISNINYARARALNVGLIICSLLISVLLGFIISRSLLLQLGAEPNYTSDVIYRIARGDLSVEVNTNPKDQGSILFAIRQMVVRLSEIIGDVRSTADSLSSASEELSATAQSLSQASTQQAASIEETSAAMEEISAASDEQTMGASQITTAISQISIATQQNSSSAEELYSTAEELTGQAVQLQQMMEFFKLRSQVA